MKSKRVTKATWVTKVCPAMRMRTKTSRMPPRCHLSTGHRLDGTNRVFCMITCVLNFVVFVDDARPDVGCEEPVCSACVIIASVTVLSVFPVRLDGEISRKCSARFFAR